MALNGTITAGSPDTYGLQCPGSRHNIVLTFPVAANTSIAANDLVKLTASYATKCAAKTDLVIGMAVQAADNTTATATATGQGAGAAGDKWVSVVVKGIIEQDAVTDTGNNTALVLGTLLYVSDAVTSYCAAGQAVAAYLNTNGTVIGKCLDFKAATAATTRVRVLIDLLDNVISWS